MNLRSLIPFFQKMGKKMPKNNGSAKRKKNRQNRKNKRGTKNPLSAMTMSAPLMTGTTMGPFSSRMATPFPPRFRTSMEFAKVKQIGLASGLAADTTTPTELSFRLNSLYDPDPTGSDRPLGFSTLAAIYARYRVDRVRVSLRFHFASQPLWCVVAVVPPSSTFSTQSISVDECMRNPFVAVLPIAPDSVSTKQSFVTIEKQFSVAQLMGWTKAQYENQTGPTTGSDATNPTAGSIPYLLLNAAPQSTLGSSQQVKVDVRIIFDVIWYERDVLLA